MQKADTATALPDTEGTIWKTRNPRADSLLEAVEGSTILPQCIRAYRSNIAGFGLGVRYADDLPETDTRIAEFVRLQGLLKTLCQEKPLKELFEEAIEDRETYGVGYIEVIRDLRGAVVRLSHVPNPDKVEVSEISNDCVTSAYAGFGTAQRRFVRYRQQVGYKTVYFKAFGDSRFMHKDTGEYVTKGLSLPQRANELIALKTGRGAYGEVRWSGQIQGVAGARQAEALNYNYFRNGRHMPMAITVSGGTLSGTSIEALRQYANQTQGVAAQHKILVLQADDNDPTGMAGADKPAISIENLAAMLQRDELFQAYIDNTRRRVQSAFRLPDIYVGYTTDYNRATAQTARELTEEQVFQPERDSLEWLLNNQVLAGYGFTCVWAFFKTPKISNPDDLTKILTVAERAGGITPNAAKGLAFGAMGEEFEPYAEDWGEIPLARDKRAPIEVQKSAGASQDDILGVLREVRKALEGGSHANA
ncbi:MAG: phage portal protein [Oscillospiraceae bacterium]|nr:phage portal protein [Oscillospiraceae bacterium]